MSRRRIMIALVVWLSSPSHDANDGLSVMAFIIHRPTARRMFHGFQQHQWDCCRIPMTVNPRRRSLPRFTIGRTNRINDRRLLPLASTDQSFTDDTIQGQNDTSRPMKIPGRGIIPTITQRLALPLSVQGWLVRIVTGKTMTTMDNNNHYRLPQSMRPGWARDWMPTWLTCLRPSVQLLASLFLYLFHTLVVTQVSIPLPFQLIPNERGNFQSINLDSLVGMATLGTYEYFRRQPANFFQQQQTSNTTTSSNTALQSELRTTMDASEEESRTNGSSNNIRDSSYLPPLWSTPRARDMPWKDIWTSKYSQFTSFWALLALIKAYFLTGGFSLWWEDRFYELAVSFPITVAMHRALCVLFGHASWVVFGALVLRWIPRPQPFFQQPISQWFTSGYRNTQWLWWTMGGYFVSAWLFNVADFVNSYVLPMAVLDAAADSSVVSQLVNPEGQDWVASVVGYIAPCINAPWWEEMLYRGFLLPALVLQFRYPLAVLFSGVLFSAHHHSLPAFIPLCVLGWTWAILYTKSRNLWTTIVIHAMWNSRIFLGSWLGV